MTALAGMLKEYLWSISVSESRAVAMAVQLARSRILGAEDRDYAGDVLHRDEARHARWARGAARSLGACDRLRAGTYALDQFPSDIATVARLHWGETFVLKFEGQLRAILAAVNRPDLVAGWDALIRDEEGHAAWGHAVLRQLAMEREDWAREIRAHFTMRTHPDREITRRFGAIYRNWRREMG
jgi:hypothetical protein